MDHQVREDERRRLETPGRARTVDNRESGREAQSGGRWRVRDKWNRPVDRTSEERTRIVPRVARTVLQTIPGLCRESPERFFRQFLDCTPGGWKRPQNEPTPEVIVGASIGLLYGWSSLGYATHFAYVDVRTFLSSTLSAFSINQDTATTVTSMVTTAKAIVDYRSGTLPVGLKSTTTFIHRYSHMVAGPRSA